MSVAGHNLPGAERQADDFYETPAWVTRAILPHVSLGSFPLDPGAGAGAILAEYPNAWGLEIDPGRSGTCRGRGLHCLTRDVLTPEPWAFWPGRDTLNDLGSGVIMNPPFKLALEFVTRALAETRYEVVALLRLAFLESQGRAEFHRQNPADVFVLSERPSFVEHLKWKTSRCNHIVPSPKGAAKRCELELHHASEHRALGTDSTAYAWFRWPQLPQRGPSYPARIRIL